MNIFSTLVGWAKSAWSALTGLPGDVGKAIAGAWHYITSVHNALSWITSNPVLGLAKGILQNLSVFHLAQIALHDALVQLARWVWIYWIHPAVTRLDRRITALAAWTAWQLLLLRALTLRLYALSLAYARQLTAIERAGRVKADKAEHAAMLAAVKAALATVQRQAASGYNAGLHDRLGTIGTLLNDLAGRTPAIRGAVSLLARAVIDLETIDNPIERAAIAKLLQEVIAKAGVDKVTGDLIGRLLGPLEGQPRARGLYDMAKDASDRLTALERQWADFMTEGGPEIEQAGREWKALTGVVTDAGLLAMFGLAVADPQAWATGVADTVGAAGNATLDEIVGLIRKA